MCMYDRIGVSHEGVVMARRSVGIDTVKAPLSSPLLSLLHHGSLGNKSQAVIHYRTMYKYMYMYTPV